MINKQQHDNTPIAKSYMKEIFENNQALDIQKLIQKLVMLMTLISICQGAQSIKNLRVSDILVAILFMSLIKQSKPIKHMVPLCFQTYNKKPKFCSE